MNRDRWDEKRIEELLKQVPKIRDTRSKEEVFERLKKDGVFDEEPPKTSQIVRKRTKAVPWLIAAAALFLAILIPFLESQFVSHEATPANEKSEFKIEDQKEMETFGVFNEEGQQGISAMEADIKTAVYPEQLEGNTLFRIGLASDEASIPVSILIPNEKILEDFGKENPTQVELYNAYAPRLNEKLLGFNEYHPYAGKIAEQNGKIIHQLPKDQNPYNDTDASLAMYYTTLNDTFTDYHEVEVVDEKNQRVQLKEAGEENVLRLNGGNRQNGYFKYVQKDGAQFLAPTRKTYPTVEQAMEALKTDTDDVYCSVILPDVDYSVTVENGVVKVTFKQPLDLFNYNPVEAMQMIEGMLLTAAGFNKAVQFVNIVQLEWEGFDFTKPLPIPVGPNELPYTVLEN